MNPVLWVDAHYDIRNAGNKNSSRFTHAEIFHYETIDSPPFNQVLIRKPTQTNEEFYEAVQAELTAASNAREPLSPTRQIAGVVGHRKGYVTFHFGTMAFAAKQIIAAKCHATYSSRRHLWIWMARKSLQKDVRSAARKALLDMICKPGHRAEQLVSLLDYALVEGLIDQDWYGWFVREVEHYREQSCPAAWRERDGSMVADALMPEVIKHLEKATCEL